MKRRDRPERVSIADGRDALLSSHLERDWQNHVLLQAALGGWHGFHIRVSMGTIDGVHHNNAGQFPRRADHDDAVGIPDLLLVNPSRHILLMPELKRTAGVLSPGQKLWASWLADIRVVSAPLWRPQDETEVSRILLGR